MTQINIDGNIYIQGLTLPNNPGVGTVNCIISGLSGDTPYEFIVVAVNENGYSGYAGPILVNTLSEFETQEQYIGRPPIVAWGGLPYGSFLGGFPETFGSGSTLNYVVSSTDLNHPVWSGRSSSTGTTGYTAPDGSLNAFLLTNPSRGQNLLLPIGNTYIYSFYYNVSQGNTGPIRIGAYVGDGSRLIKYRQILPTEVASATTNTTVIVPNDGITGWRRFAFEFYLPVFSYYQALSMTFISMDNPSGKSIYYWGPQVEKAN